MSNEELKSSQVKDVIDAATGLIKAAPVYDDAIQPAAKEIGKSLETIAKAVNVALSPVSALVWGYSQIEEFISINVAEKLKNIPSERIITPDIMVAGPTLEALRYAGHKKTLREMYANLLATALDSKVATSAHPSFVEVIKQLAPHEAELMKELVSLESYPIVIGFYHKTSTQHGFFNYKSNESIDIVEHIVSLGKEAGVDSSSSKIFLSNLLRLRILEIIEEVNIYDHYDGLSSESIENTDFSKGIDLEQSIALTLKFSEFGQSFVSVCVNEEKT